MMAAGEVICQNLISAIDLNSNSGNLRNRFVLQSDFFEEFGSGMNHLRGMPRVVNFYCTNFQQVLNKIAN